jgi:hypothetical protein
MYTQQQEFAAAWQGSALSPLSDPSADHVIPQFLCIVLFESSFYFIRGL